MKQYFTLFFILIMGLLSKNLWAQNTIPQGFNYQAVIRDANGGVASNVPVKLIFEILDSSPSGSIAYSEQHNIAQTNDYGLVNLVIGQGTVLSGQFSAVNWAASAKFLRISADINNLGSYIVLGGPGASTQLMSVPYALASGNSAATAGQGIKIANNQISLDPQNAQNGQVLKWNGSAWEPQADNSGSVTLAAGAGIGITQNGSTYTISNNGDTNPNDDLTTSTTAGGDVSGVFSDLQIKAGAVNTTELANGAVTAAKLNTMGAANGQVLKFQNGVWVPATDNSGNLYTEGAGITIVNNQINSTWARTTPNSIHTNNPFDFVGIGDLDPQSKLSIKYDEQTDPNLLDNAVLDVVYNGSNSDVAAIRGEATGEEGIGGAFTGASLGLYAYPSSPDGTGIVGNSDNGFGIVAGTLSGTALLAFSPGGEGAKAAEFLNGNVDILYGDLNANQSINVNSYNTGTLRSALNKNVADAGIVLTVGAGEQPNFFVSTVFSANNGYAAVAANGSYEAGMYVDNNGNGVLFGDIKNFRMPHPTKPGKEIWYASVEGPEAAAYTRGTATMVNGEATVIFSEDYEIVASPGSMTVLLTPLDAESKGMAVVEKTANGFKVKELMHGTGNYQFDWEVKCVRKGYENYRVIRDERECQPAPQAEKTTLKHAIPDHVHNPIKPGGN